MKKYGLGASIAIIVTIILYLFLRESLPKDVGRLPFFVGILVLDLYLWSSIKKFIFLYHKIVKYTILVLYWLPAAALIGTAISTFFVDFFDWNNTFRAYLFGIIFVFYAAKLVPYFSFLSTISSG